MKDNRRRYRWCRRRSGQCASRPIRSWTLLRPPPLSAQ